MNSDSPIIVLDSGVGGLTVVSALLRALPKERIAYFGDTARLPYGNKSAATVSTFVRQIIRFLRPMSPKHVVIACNTATALALPAMREEFPDLAITGVIDPGARAAVAAAGSKKIPRIGVIATEATVKSRAYDRAILRRRHHAHVFLKPTPLLVHLIEEGRSNEDPLIDLALRQYLSPLLERKIDVLVLGCTHYPILKSAITRVVGGSVTLIDSAEQCARDVAARLTGRLVSDADLPLAAGQVPPPQGPVDAIALADRLQCFVTDDATRFSRLASQILGMQVQPPILVPLEALDDLGQAAVTVKINQAAIAGMIDRTPALRVPA